MTNALSEVRDEARGAVAVEMVALTSAAIGLCLSLVATPGDAARQEPVGGGIGEPFPAVVISNHFGE